MENDKGQREPGLGHLIHNPYCCQSDKPRPSPGGASGVKRTTLETITTDHQQTALLT